MYLKRICILYLIKTPIYVCWIKFVHLLVKSSIYLLILFFGLTTERNVFKSPLKICDCQIFPIGLTIFALNI